MFNVLNLYAKEQKMTEITKYYNIKHIKNTI